MRIVPILYLLVVLLCAFSSPAMAQPPTGKIIDIYGKGITTIQVEGGHSFTANDTVELVYMAGLLPMLIGQYQITTATRDIFLAKPLSQNIPPDIGMKVVVDLVKTPSISPQVEISPPHSDTQKKADRDSKREIVGEVIEVAGDDIKVTYKGEDSPGIGWSVDLFYVATKTGKEYAVGTWKVVSLEGQTLSAVKVSGVGDANKKLKAVIHNRPKKQPVASSPTPSPTKTKLAAPATPRTHQSASPKPSQPNEFRGKGSSFDTYKDELEANPKPFAKDASGTRSPARKFTLGIKIQKNSNLAGQAFGSEPVGIRIVGIAPGSPAEMANLELADIIYIANGVRVSDPVVFIDTLQKSLDGKFKLRIQRDSEIIEKTVLLKKNPGTKLLKNEPSAKDKAAFTEYKEYLIRNHTPKTSMEKVQYSMRSYWSPAQYYIGIEVANNDRLAGQVFGSVQTGARVLWVSPSSPVKRALRVADIICEANGIRVRDAEQFKTIVKSTTEKKMHLKLHRNYKVVEKTVKLKKLK